MGKIIHFPADIKTHRSNCVNTEREIGRKESCAVCTVVEANSKKKDKYREERQKTDGKEEKRLKHAGCIWETTGRGQ